MVRKRKLVLVMALSLGIVMLIMHFAVVVSLYLATAKLEIQLANHEKLAQVTKAFAEITSDLDKDLDKIVRELPDAEGITSQPSEAAPQKPASEGENVGSLETARVSKEPEYPKDILDILRRGGVDINSLEELEWRPIKKNQVPKEIKELLGKIEGENSPRELYKFAAVSHGYFPVSKGEICLFKIKRIYHWPIWLIVYLVIGCLVVAFVMGMISVMVFRDLKN